VFVNSGVARGSGWQHIGAYVNLGAYYLCGIPVAVVLGFFTKLRGMGLWIGLQTGAFIQTIMLSIIISCTNWEKQVYPPLLVLPKIPIYFAWLPRNWKKEKGRKFRIVQ
jgi:Na+-driven multidrug efflux pump